MSQQVSVPESSPLDLSRGAGKSRNGTQPANGLKPNAHLLAPVCSNHVAGLAVLAHKHRPGAASVDSAAHPGAALPDQGCEVARIDVPTRVGKVVAGNLCIPLVNYSSNVAVIAPCDVLTVGH